MLFVELSSTGALESAIAHHDADGNEFAYAVTATPDGGYLVGSDVPGWGWGFGRSDLLLSKFNASGFNEWSKLIGHWSYDTPHRIIGTSDGGYLISGNLTSATRSIQAGLTKLDSAYNLQWASCGGGTDYEYGYGVIQTSDGGYAQIAMSMSYGSTNEIMLIKYDSEGNYCEPDSQALSTIDHSIMFNPVMVDVNTSPLVLETITPDIATLSRRDSLLCAGMDVEETSLPAMSSLSLFPNPFNASVAISAPGAEKVEIVDIQGRIVKVIEGDLSRETTWIPSEGTPTGVYFVRATFSDGRTSEQRAVFMK
ncbi:MAG TPA: T9SS type A sorting domain-containing protein [candidate division Zixibacteria bacterium]|nr:T9SS type A sorting domain-containing protein [candidate division Zixibacteria bacterium]